ncbi:MAG: BatA domain-containing protein [Planctomycetota bacterium]|jgi:hypothetical protein
MTFLNAMLALGAMAFSIPLIIHLLNRSRYLTIDWGAMQFLESSVRVNARRIQWKQLLLLLIRCLIPVLLALAMARPIVLSWRDSGAANAMALAVVLDDSMSMQTIDDPSQQPGVTRWKNACRQMVEIADQLPTGSSLCLVLTGSPPEVYRDLDAASWRKQLDILAQQSTYAGKLDLSTSVERGLEWLQQSSLAKRHLVVVSDFAASDWTSGPQSKIQEARQRIAKQPVPVPWSFLNVAKPTSENDSSSDVAIKTMEIAPRVATLGSPLTVTASLQNFSQSPQQVPVRLSADSEEIEMQSLTVPPRSTMTTRFRWIPKSKGDIQLRVDTANQDRTPADNSMTRVMRVMVPLRVMLVDGARRPEAMTSESDFVRYALTPFALLQGLPGDAFSTRVVDSNGWDEATLGEHDLVLCCNVPDLSPQHRRWLRTFVERGGGVLFALGDGVQIDRYNTWEPIPEKGLRPGKLGPRAEWTGSVQTTDSPFFDLAPQVTESMSSIRFRHRTTIQESESSAWCGFAYDDGKPWIISFPIGRGRCLWMLSSCDDGDSNFPAKPAYLPILQKLLLFAAQTPSGWRWIEPGNRWVEDWETKDTDPPTSIEWISLGDAQREQSVTTTALKPIDRQGGGQSIYSSEIEAPRRAGVVQARLGSEVRKIMIDASPADRGEELSRDLLADERFENAAQQADAGSATSVDTWLSQVRSRWSGRELWWWCWVLLIALVLAETALQQSFMPKRTAPLPASTSESSPSNTSRGAA